MPAGAAGNGVAVGQSGLPAALYPAAEVPAAEAQSGWQFQPLFLAGSPAGEAAGGWPIQEVAVPAPALQALPSAPLPEAAPLGGAATLPALLAPAPAPSANQTVPPETCWAQVGVDFPGGDLAADGNSTCCINPGDCCRLCWDTPGCGAWTFRAVDVRGGVLGEATQGAAPPIRLPSACEHRVSMANILCCQARQQLGYRPCLSRGWPARCPSASVPPRLLPCTPTCPSRRTSAG